MLLFVKFDGEEIDGKRYALGDAIDENADPNTVQVLRDLGRLTETRPSTADAVITLTPADKPVAEMTRTELKAAVMSLMEDHLDTLDDDKLRAGVEHYRSLADDKLPTDKLNGGEDDDLGEDEAYGDVKDRPLNSLKAGELAIVANAEGVTFGPDVKTNADKVNAIQAERDAKLASSDPAPSAPTADTSAEGGAGAPPPPPTDQG